MQSKIKYAVTGGLAGAANGLFGAGGGMLLVPLLVRWCKLEEKRAFATSVAVIFLISIVSAFIYWTQAALDLYAAFPYLAGGLIGGIISGHIFKKIKMVWIRRAFGVLIIYGGIRAVLLL